MTSAHLSIFAGVIRVARRQSPSLYGQDAPGGHNLVMNAQRPTSLAPRMDTYDGYRMRVIAGQNERGHLTW